MNNTWALVFFGIATAYFGVRLLQIVPIVFKLLIAFWAGVVKWPGPRVHDRDQSASAVRARLGVGYQNLFPAFAFNLLGVVGAFVFSLLTFLSSTSLMSGHVRINWTCTVVIVALIVLAGGEIGFRKAQRNAVQVDTILSDLAKDAEPRAVDGQSAEAEYAIEHPLIGHRILPTDIERALDLYYESVRCHQDGDEYRAMILYQEATRTDPSLHKNAREALLKMAQDCSSGEEGAVYYWLGIHSENLADWRQAAGYYSKAIDAYAQMGYQKRQSRAHCNLGNVKMRLNDPSAMEEFERAIALNPRNGTAHINIGTIYYGISERGDPRFERALDAFADAIVADPSIYGPIVTSRLRSIGYTWKEDLEDITLRVASKQLGVSLEADAPAQRLDEVEPARKEPIGFGPSVPMEGPDRQDADQKRRIGFGTNAPVEKAAEVKTYRDKKHGFEIDIPKDWTVYKEILPALAPTLLRLAYGWDPSVDVAFTCGPNEILNIVVETMRPEPTPGFTESFFKLYAQRMGFTNCEYGRIIVGNKAHTWSRYQFENQVWSKKYLIVLGGKGYAITASCNDKGMFLQREKIWDAIAASFRLTPINDVA
jgi:tetratricopeptide (TPR) repeat protein